MGFTSAIAIICGLVVCFVSGFRLTRCRVWLRANRPSFDSLKSKYEQWRTSGSIQGEQNPLSESEMLFLKQYARIHTIQFVYGFVGAVFAPLAVMLIVV